MKKASLLCSLLLLFACSSDSDTGGDSGAGETQKFTLLVAPNEGGTVSTAGGSYTKGTTVTITATPNPDYLFDRWTGSVNSQENPLELTINKNENIEANFIKKQYELAVNIEGEGTVDEKLLESAKSYDAGSRVELTAVPAEDWQFEQWIIDDEVITENPIELVIDKAMSVETKFTPDYLSINNSEVQTFELINVDSSIYLEEQEYNAVINNLEIQLFRTDDYQLTFTVPELESGEYTLTSGLGKLVLNVAETQVSNTEEIIQNVFENFNTEIDNLDSSDPFIANEITEAESYNNEVLELYNSLSYEQKRQTAMFYEANKEVFENFKNDIITNLNGPTALSSIPQTDCPTHSSKSFYTCTAENLGNSAIALTKSSKEFLKLLVLAGASAYLAPASFGLSAFGTLLGLGTAAYIFMTEIRPYFIEFKSSLRAFIFANWILTQGTFLYVVDEFTSAVESGLNVIPNFRSMNSNDNGISEEIGFFVTALNDLNIYWNQLTALFGSPINYQDTSENVEFDNNTDQLNVSNISNNNVRLESLNGQNITFKSLSGNDESFNYDLEVIKEGFSRTQNLNAIVRKQIDSIPIYEQAVLGSWTVTTLESQNNNNLVLYQGGTGKYIVNDDEYNISWEIVKRNGKYHLREYGFYHYGFEQYRTFDVTLPENFLTYPASTFLTYTDFGDGPGSPGRRYSKS